MSEPAKLQKTLYTAHATAVGGREGHVKADDGAIDVELAIPAGMGGPGGAGTNPEQLFASGYAACFGSAVAFAARQKQLAPESITIDASVPIGSIASGQFALAVELKATLPGLSRDDALGLVEAAHRICPYSNATRGNIEVSISVV